MIADDLNWDDVRVFATIAQTGSLTQAALALGLSQPTVGRRLRSLEARLGAKLFERLPNRLVLTSHGERLMGGAEAMQAGAAAWARRALARPAETRQPVRITATASVALFVTTHIESLLPACPEAEIAVIGTRAAQNLARREAEIALRMRRMPGHGDLVARKLGRFAFTLYASRGYWERQGRNGTVDFSRLDFIGLPETERTPSQSRWLDEIARHGAIRCRLGELGLRHRAIEQGLGVSLLPCFLGDAEGDLVRLLDPPAELVEDVFLLMHKDMRESPAVRCVADALCGLFRRQADAILGIVDA